jgi:radical SAM/Cys-rich protein
MKANDQLEILSKKVEAFSDLNCNHKENGRKLPASALKTLQINIGKKCNQSCRHCHVGASPSRTEAMTRDTVDACLGIISKVHEIETIDITGGAPEMNPYFTYLVEQSLKLGKRVIDRCNLTILEEPGFEYLYEFLAGNHVEVVASLPHFRKNYTDRQRGPGVYDKSIRALKRLNQLGYGDDRILNLVYNPVGMYLSAPQKQLEREFKEYLAKQYDIRFNSLLCINNMPIDGFFNALMKVGKLESYMALLRKSFNPDTLKGLMCRHQLSVSHDGYLYDCDFNQMLSLGCLGHISSFDYDKIIKREIATANHCYGCTAGAGSSCGGEISG